MGCCSVPLCSASSDYEVCVFSMPNNHELRIKWLDFLIESRDLAGIENPKFNQKKFYKICENHFLPEDVLRGAARKFLRKGAVPVRKEYKTIQTKSGRVVKRRSYSIDEDPLNDSQPHEKKLDAGKELEGHLEDFLEQMDKDKQSERPNNRSCPRCKRQFLKLNGLTTHMKFCLMKKSIAIPLKTADSSFNKLESKPTLSCSTCMMEFEHEFLREIHGNCCPLLTMSRFSCFCGETFKTAEDLKFHTFLKTVQVEFIKFNDFPSEDSQFFNIDSVL